MMGIRDWKTSEWREDGPYRFVSETTYIQEGSVPKLDKKITFYNRLEWEVLFNGWVLSQYVSPDIDVPMHWWVVKNRRSRMPREDPDRAKALASTVDLLTGRFPGLRTRR